MLKKILTLLFPLKGKSYYLPGYHRIVYCHAEKDGKLILGEICIFLGDAKTNIMRQEISEQEFIKLNPIEINEHTAAQHTFLQKDETFGTWRVRMSRQAFVKQPISIPLKNAVQTGIVNKSIQKL